MDNTVDGASKATQNAQSDDTTTLKRSFLRRLFWFLNVEDNNVVTMGSNETQRESLSALSRLTVEDVAIPRSDIVGVVSDANLEDLMNIFRTSGYSRLPVYDETLDNTLGMLHLKDVALKYGFSDDSDTFDINVVMRPVLFVPPSMRLNVLLQKMQADRMHFALMVDEYGGIDGLITIEDLIEQVVGDISDEHDTSDDETWTEERPGIYLCSARTPLEEFEKLLGVDLLSDNEDDDIDTLGGLVFMLVGRVPTRNEVIAHDSGFDFQIVEADPRRVKRIRVYKRMAKK